MLKERRRAESVSLTSSVDEALQGWELPLAKKPEGADEDYARLPRDLTAVGSRELGRYQATMTAWYVYANEQMARVDLMLAELKYGGDKAKIPLWKGKRIRLRAIVTNFEMMLKVVSREITRRQNAAEKEYRRSLK